MDSVQYIEAQKLRKRLHEIDKSENKNESQVNESKEIKEKLENLGCGSQQINEDSKND